MEDLFPYENRKIVCIAEYEPVPIVYVYEAHRLKEGYELRDTKQSDELVNLIKQKFPSCDIEF